MMDLKAFFTREIYSEVKIEAPLADVWRAIKEVDQYRRWNPFIDQVRGEFAVNVTLSMRVCTPGHRPQWHRARVLEIRDEHEVRWVGLLWGIPGGLRGDHRFVLVKEGPRSTKLIHREVFTGFLVPLVWSIYLNRDFRRGFESLNSSLREYVENG